MSDISRRAVLVGSLAAGFLATARPAAASGGAPFTVPALQSWQPGPTPFALPPSPTVVVRPGDAAVLRAVADDLAADLSALTGRSAAVRVHAGTVRAGEIRLALAATGLGSEGYRLRVADAVEVEAAGRLGAVHAAQTILQLLAGGARIPGGTAEDRPRYAERGLMVDVGRKYYDLDWLKDRVRELAFYKMNVLHLHFTDDQGWRIESAMPGVHSEEHLTKAEVADLLAHAERYGVSIVPETDFPGHLTAGLRNYPQHQLVNVLGQASPGKLDYTSAAARAWAKALVAEYLEVFPGPYFHLGADEYLTTPEQLLHPHLARYACSRYGLGATVKDGILGFLNELNALVRSRGRTTRVWNDGLSGGRRVRLDLDVDVDWWTDISPLGDLIGIESPQELLDRGHRVVNCSWYPTYVTTLPVPPAPDPAYAYEKWRVHRFHGAVYLNGDVGTPWKTVAPDEPRNRGAKLHFWNDDPTARTAAEDAELILPRLRIIAQHTWESPLVESGYAGFEARSGAVAVP